MKLSIFDSETIYFVNYWFNERSRRKEEEIDGRERDRWRESEREKERKMEPICRFQYLIHKLYISLINGSM